MGRPSDHPFGAPPHDRPAVGRPSDHPFGAPPHDRPAVGRPSDHPFGTPPHDRPAVGRRPGRAGRARRPPAASWRADERRPAAAVRWPSDAVRWAFAGRHGDAPPAVPVAATRAAVRPDAGLIRTALSLRGHGRQRHERHHRGDLANAGPALRVRPLAGRAAHAARCHLAGEATLAVRRWDVAGRAGGGRGYRHERHHRGDLANAGPALRVRPLAGRTAHATRCHLAGEATLAARRWDIAGRAGGSSRFRE